MKAIMNRILNSEFLTFSEVLRLKVALVTIFLSIFVVLTIPLSSLNEFQLNINIIVPIGFGALLAITLLLMVINMNRWAMHFSIYTIIGLTLYYVGGSYHFYGYMLFFVTLTVIIFYQDIITYLIYGGAITIYGVIYIVDNINDIVGANSAGIEYSSITYQSILLGFYLIFLIQFIVSDNIYEKMNNEWVRMNKVLEKYQDFSFETLKSIEESKEQEPVYENPEFQQAVSELSIFINEFFEEKGDNIAEFVEYFFFLHGQDLTDIVKDKSISPLARKYAVELQKYILNDRTELISILFDFSTMFKASDEYNKYRYEYSLDKLFPNKIDKLLSLAILYKFLRSEVTQYDKWGKIELALTHKEITKRFTSKEFREFISFEQVNFYLDNQELFDKYL